MNKDSEKRLLIWVDVETTSLAPVNGAILEVGAIVTTKDLEELGRFRSVVQLPSDRTVDFPAFNVAMHSKNGLLEQIASHPTPEAISPGNVALRFATFQRATIELATSMGYLDPGTRNPLHPAGSSVHFDVGFLKHQMPSVTEWWHHRHVDVSTLKLLFRAWVGDPFGDGEERHRAMEDVLYSIGIARFFKEFLQNETQWRSNALDSALAMERKNPSRL